MSPRASRLGVRALGPRPTAAPQGQAARAAGFAQALGPSASPGRAAGDPGPDQGCQEPAPGPTRRPGSELSPHYSVEIRMSPSDLKAHPQKQVPCGVERDPYPRGTGPRSVLLEGSLKNLEESGTVFFCFLFFLF